MSTQKHTQGPWKIMADPMNAGKHPCHDNRWITTADTQVEFGHDPRSWGLSSGTLICEMRDHIEAPEANARLIAAAPELLEALKDCRAHLLALHSQNIDRSGTNQACYEAAMSAIAKAEGRA